MALTERPHDYSYSLNDIRYVFTLSDLTRTGLFLQVKIMYAKMDDLSFTELYTFDGLKPDNSGKIYLYMQAYLHSVLSYKLPTIGATVTEASDQACRFYVEYREIWDASPDTEWTTSESENERIVFKGGIEQNKFSRNNIFINYIDTSKPFLTWTPTNNFVWSDEPVYLSFINKALAGFFIRIDMKAIDGTTASTFVDCSSQTKILYHLLVSSIQLGLEFLFEKKIYYYDVSILDSTATSTMINPHRFYVEYDKPNYEFYDLVYHNSLGGLNGIRINGEIPISYDRAITDADNGKDVNDWNATAKTAVHSLSAISLTRKYKGNIGILKCRTKDQQEAHLDLLASKSIYMLTGSWWNPVLSVQASQELNSKRKITDGFPIEWQLSDSNEVFTPMNKNFGLGSL